METYMNILLNMTLDKVGKYFTWTGHELLIHHDPIQFVNAFFFSFKKRYGFACIT
eukprot:SAG11_NODE_786_length_7172_cov_3.635939_2_plen_55_part_00